MTALSWIFGGKKKEDKPITVEVGNEEDFTILPANTGQQGIYPIVPTYPPSQFYTPLPYNILQQHQDQQAVTSNARTNVQNQLDGVPFVLSSSLEQGSKQSSEVLSGLEDLRRAVFQIAADINDTAFDYNFKLEHTVLEEASIYHSNNHS